MPIQTTYPENMPLGLEGQLADDGGDRHTRAYVEENGVEYFFGRAVERGTADDEYVSPLGTLADFLGVTTRTQATELSSLPPGATLEAIPATKPANVLSKGRVIVFPENAVAPGDSVFYRFQNTGVDPEGQGRFRSDNDAASGDVVEVTAGARWLSSAAAGEAAILELNLPQ